jgi:serine phosphatase RsbU (regulator of sigma subunit)
MDISIVSIDKKSGKLYFSGAVNPLYVIQKGELKVTKGDVWSIGGGGLFRPGTSLEERKFSIHEIDIEEDTQFYMFTDGYIDQFGGDENKKFNTRRFEKLILDISKLQSEDQKNKISNTLEEWMASSNKGQIDDILVVGLRV